MLALFDYRLIKHYKFSITFRSELLLGQSKTSTTSRRSRSLVFSVCGVHGSIVHEHGWSCNGWLSRCGTPWVSRTSSKFRQVVMLALELDQWQFAITGKVPPHHDGSVYVGMSSLDAGRMEMLRGTFLLPLGFALKGLPGEDTSYCPFRDIKYSTNGCSFYTHHRSPYYTPSLSIGRTYCGCLEEILPFKRHGQSEFTGYGFVTTGSITMKHARNGVNVSISKSWNFHKNTINFTESNKSLKTNLILKNIIVSHLERGTHLVKHLAPLFVLWKCCTPNQLYCLQNWKHSSDWKVFKNQKQKNGHYFWRGV